MRVAAVITAVQGAALAVVAVGYGVEAFVGAPKNFALTLLAAGMGLAAGAVLLLLARGLRRHRRWTVSPIVLTEIICLPVAYGLAQGHLWAAAAAVGLPAVVVLGALASPAGRAVARGEG